ncbi:MAG: M1 family metallopeptidase [Acidimicrobiia bacterium]|nr:M1 family metallopeptidase [Acidimicrobiia bacterium]
MTTRPRLLLAAVAVVLTAASCSDTNDAATTSVSEPQVTAPTTSRATSTTTTAAPPATADAFAGLVVPEAEALGIGDDYFPTLGNPGYDVDHYTLDLVFQPDSITLDGIATIEATATADLVSINLDFTVLEAVQVQVDGEDAEWQSVEEDLVITPSSTIPAGEAFVIDVTYGGEPKQARSGAVPFGIGWQTVNDQNYVVAEPDAAHSWFPNNDHPLDKATYTFRLNVPDGTTAAANGTLVERITDLGREIFVWEMASPMASYLATVVIGDFDIVEDEAASAEAGIPIRHVLPVGKTVADYPGLERTGEMVRFLEEKFGPYPFDTYGIAVVDGFGAALENQTLSLFDSNLAESFFFEDVLVHELAHHWFGNSVSPGAWQDIWLNEGFASYAEWLWIEREASREFLEQEIALERDEFAGAGFPAPGEPPVFELFGPAVYRVGAMTLHALRLTVGDESFFELLTEHATRFANGAARTADFIAVAEEVAGLELDALFDSWLYDRAVPEFPAG